MGQIEIFNSEQFGEIRTLNIGGEPWFCLSDVCKALEIGNPSQLKTRLYKDGVISNEVIDSHRRKQQASFINEPNLYRAIFQSRKENAEQFTNWITKDVIPSIRKHGAYMTPETIEKVLLSPDFIIQLATQLKEEQAKSKRLEEKIVADAPKVAFADKVADASNLLDMNAMAKLLNDQDIPIGRNRLFKWLRDNKYLRKNNEPYQKYIENGMFEIKELTYQTPYGQQVCTKTYVTGKGQIILAEIQEKSIPYLLII